MCPGVRTFDDLSGGGGQKQCALLLRTGPRGPLAQPLPPWVQSLAKLASSGYIAFNSDRPRTCGIINWRPRSTCSKAPRTWFVGPRHRREAIICRGGRSIQICSQGWEGNSECAWRPLLDAATRALGLFWYIDDPFTDIGTWRAT